jgi:hypothetical protein
VATAIGNLVVRLGAMTAPFDRKMNASRGTLGRFGAAAGMATGKLMAMAGVATGAVGTAAMGMLVRGQMSAIDTAAKLSDRLGIATERLAGLRHAAELTGAGADTLDAGLTTMAKRLGEAARGAGAAKPALEAMGLDAAELGAMRPADAFYEIAEAISKIPEPSKRAAAAANIFSKGNMNLINTLALGKSGLVAAQREAEKLGLTFSRVDAAKVEAANDAMYKMKAAFSGIWRQLAIKIAPAIEAVANKLTEWFPVMTRVGRVYVAYVKSWIGWIRAFGQSVIDAVRPAFAWVANSLSPVANAFRSAFQAIVKNVDVMLGSWEGFRGAVVQYVVQYTQQTTLSVMALWEHVSSWFKIKLEQLKGFFVDMWQGASQGLVKHTMPAFSRLFIWLQKKFTEARGEKWLLTPEEEQRTILSEQKAALAKLTAIRTQNEKDTNDKIAALRTAHDKKMAAIGQASLDATRDWEQRMGKLPILSDKLRAAWEGAAKAEIAMAPRLAVAGGPGDVAVPQQGSRYPEALDKGSVEAWSRILSQMRPKQEKDEEKIAKNTTIANALLTSIREAILDTASETMEVEDG